MVLILALAPFTCPSKMPLQANVQHAEFFSPPRGAEIGSTTGPWRTWNHRFSNSPGRSGRLAAGWNCAKGRRQAPLTKFKNISRANAQSPPAPGHARLMFLLGWASGFERCVASVQDRWAQLDFPLSSCQKMGRGLIHPAQRAFIAMRQSLHGPTNRQNSHLRLYSNQSRE